MNIEIISWYNSVTLLTTFLIYGACKFSFLMSIIGVLKWHKYGFEILRYVRIITWRIAKPRPIVSRIRDNDYINFINVLTRFLAL